MKKNIILILLLLVVSLSVFTACNNTNDVNPVITNKININGDIVGATSNIELKDIKTSAFTYTDKTNNEVNASGYKLSDILNKVELLNTNCKLMITATDNTSALIDIAKADLCYAVLDNDKINIKAPMFPPVVGIKDVLELTVITDADVNQGIKLVTETTTSYISYGNAKLNLYNQIGGEAEKFDNSAFKYMIKTENVKLSDLTNADKNIVYLENFDVLKTTAEDSLIWKNSKLTLNRENITDGIFGIVTGTDTLTYDAFNVMKNAIDNDKKVMFILPDGFSYKQATFYNDSLDLFSSNYVRAATINPAISNVSLATLVTGCSPAQTKIVERNVTAPAVPDIFEYVKSKNKTASYIEGNKNLILTSLQPILTFSDEDGYTDKGVYENAQTELAKNPDLIFIHFHGIDDINHEYSPESPEALAKILETETYIENLMTGFQGTIVIVPDHGHIKILNEQNEAKGIHGIFETDDMYVPYYVIEQ